MARRGARQVVADPERQRAKPRTPEPERSAPPAWEPEEWVRTPDRPTRAEPRAAAETPQPTRPRRRPPADVAAELAKALGERRASKAAQQVAEAARAYERDRVQDAYRMLRPIAEEAPDAAMVRELTGLAAYRLGRWKVAIGHLEAFARLSGTLEQSPVLADCYRALGRHARVEALWQELRQASPSAALVAEGRIVMAGSLADRGQLRRAIELLEGAPGRAGRASRPHDLRVWYALADLYERVGDQPRARQLFGRVAASEPGLADVAERLQALS